MADSGDSYKRREVSPGVYQCGCYWKREVHYGDVLVECPIHKQAGEASLKRFERKQKEGNNER